MPAWFYVLRLKSGALYIGATTDLDQRYKDHCSGKACRTTQLDPPQELLYSEELDSFSNARKREAQVKRWSRGKREALASGDLWKLCTNSQNDANLDPPFLLRTKVSLPSFEFLRINSRSRRESVPFQTLSALILVLWITMDNWYVYIVDKKGKLYGYFDCLTLITVIVGAYPYRTMYAVSPRL